MPEVEGTSELCRECTRTPMNIKNPSNLLGFLIILLLLGLLELWERCFFSDCYFCGFRK